MPNPFPNLPPAQRGDLHRVFHQSEVLKSNFWGDPADRDLWVYTPPGVDQLGPLPCLLVLPAFASTGEAMLARGLCDISIATRFDRLIAQGCPPFVAAMPDTMTSLGGSQYLNSPAIGRYTDYVMDEIRQTLMQRFNLTGKWGAVGRSSGGFGALHLAFERPGELHAVGCHAGDMGFDLMFLGELGPAIRGISDGGGLETFMTRFWEKNRPNSSQFSAFNLVAMACAYTPDLEASPIPARFPVDFASGAVDFSCLKEWMRFDPVQRAQTETGQDALRQLELLFIDVGNRDEYQLHLGARRFVEELKSAGLNYVYEEFTGGHRGTAYRYDRSIPMMATALTEEI